MSVCVWVYECMSVWVYGCMSVWVYACMSVWVYECISVYILFIESIYIPIHPLHNPIQALYTPLQPYTTPIHPYTTLYNRYTTPIQPLYTPIHTYGRVWEELRDTSEVQLWLLFLLFRPKHLIFLIIPSQIPYIPDYSVPITHFIQFSVSYHALLCLLSVPNLPFYSYFFSQIILTHHPTDELPLH